MPIAVDVFSDFICPWCYVGGARLEQARQIVEARHGWRPPVRYRAFELNPDMPVGGLDRKEYRSAKFGSWARSQQMDAGTVQAGASDGLVWDYAAIERTPSTRRAHRLIKLAGAQDPALNEVLASRLLRGYFADGLDIGDPAVLVGIAGSVGVEATVGLLDDDGLDRLVENDVAAARRSGLTGVPFTVVANRAVSGAASVDEYVTLLENAALMEAADVEQPSAGT